MIPILLLSTALAGLPDQLAKEAPEALAQLEICETRGCDRAEGARAAWLLAMHRYLAEGVADGQLAVTVLLLDAELHGLLPEVVREATGEPLPFAERVGGPPPGETRIGGVRITAVRVVEDEDPATALDAYFGVWSVAVSDRARQRLDPVSNEVARTALDKGIDAEQGGRLQSAIDAYRSAYTLDSSSRAGRDEPNVRDLAALRAGMVYERLGRHESALAWTRLVFDGALLSEARTTSGFAKWKEGDLTGAKWDLGPAAKSVPLAAALFAVIESEGNCARLERKLGRLDTHAVEAERDRLEGLEPDQIQRTTPAELEKARQELESLLGLLDATRVTAGCP